MLNPKPTFSILVKNNGRVAKWSGTGSQELLQLFESTRDLTLSKTILTLFPALQISHL